MSLKVTPKVKRASKTRVAKKKAKPPKVTSRSARVKDKTSVSNESKEKVTRPTVNFSAWDAEEPTAKTASDQEAKAEVDQSKESENASTPTSSTEERRAIIDSPSQKKTLDGKPFNPNKDVSTLYKAGRGRTFWSDQEKIKDLYWKRSPEQIRATELTYADRLGREPRKDIDGSLGTRNRKVVDHLRKGDRIGAAATALQDPSLKSKAVPGLLNKLNPKERQELETNFSKYAKGKSLNQVLEQRFTSRSSTRGHAPKIDKNGLNESLSLVRGNNEQARFHGLKGALAGGKPAEVLARLRKLQPGQEKGLLESSKASGVDLKKEITSTLDGPEREQALALLQGNRVGADASLLHQSMSGWGSNKDKLWKSLAPDIKDVGKRREHLKKVAADYDAKFGPKSERKGQGLQERLKSELSGDTLDKAQNLLANGGLSTSQQLRYALNGEVEERSRVSEIINRVGASKARELFSKGTNKNLDKEASRLLSGKDGFEAKLALEGKPKTAYDKVVRAHKRLKFEDSGLGRNLTETDNFARRNYNRAKQTLNALYSAKPTERAKLERRVGELTGYTSEDIKVLAKTKEEITQNAASAATTVAVVGATVATGGALGPLTAGAVTSVVGAGTNYGSRRVFQGASYNHNNTTRDLTRGAIEGAAASGAARLGRAAGALIDKGKFTTRSAVLEGAVDGALSETIIGSAEKAMDRRTWKNGVASGVARVTQNGVTQGALGLATGGLGGGLGREILDVSGRRGGLLKTGNLLDKVRNGPSLRNRLDSLHPSPKRRALARAERANAKLQRSKIQGGEETSATELHSIRNNYQKHGVSETLKIGEQEVLVRGLRTPQERRVIQQELQQVHDRASAEALGAFKEIVVTDYPGVSRFDRPKGSKPTQVGGYFTTEKDGLVVVGRRRLGGGAGTTAHEIGHAVDAHAGKGSYKSQKEGSFGKGARESHVSQYATTNKQEDFAETFEELVVRPANLDAKARADQSTHLANKIKDVKSITAASAKRVKMDQISELDVLLGKGDPNWQAAFKKAYPDIKIPKGREAEFGANLRQLGQRPGEIGPNTSPEQFKAEFSKRAKIIAEDISKRAPDEFMSGLFDDLQRTAAAKRLKVESFTELDQLLIKSDPKWQAAFEKAYPDIKIPEGREAEFATFLRTYGPRAWDVGPKKSFEEVEKQFIGLANRFLEIDG